MYISYGQDKKYLIHILVCTAFHGLPPPDMKDPTVDHRDRQRGNNSATNLTWASRAQQGLNRETTRKVLGFLLRDNSTTFGPYNSIKQAGKALNVDNSSISKCCKGIRRTAGTTDGKALGWKYVDI